MDIQKYAKYGEIGYLILWAFMVIMGISIFDFIVGSPNPYPPLFTYST